MNRTMEIRDFINLFRKKKKIILLVTLNIMLIGGFASFAIPTKFEAKTDVLVNFTTTNIVSSGEIDANLRLIETYKYLMKSNRILNKVNNSLKEAYKKDELNQMVKIESNINSQILTILVEEKTPEKAVALVNAIATTFKEEIKTLMNLENVHILSEATVGQDTKVIKPVTTLFFIISAIIGFLVSYIFVLIQEMFYTIIDSPEKAEKALGIPVIGMIPSGEGKLIYELESNDVFTEIFRSLRANLLYLLSKQQAKTLLVTSAESGDGKSYVSANLSIVFAMDQKKTVYVDADLRRANGRKLFQLPKRIGITSYVTGLYNLQDIIQPTEVPNLYFISAGPVPPNPAELISSEKFTQLIEELKKQFDIIIIDTPPMLVADTLHISTNVDGCLYVVNAETSKLEQSIHSIEQLKKVQAPLIGSILNKSKQSIRSNSYYN
ncbi:polysaccharide biosynthesis tyrosine autokinase [Paenisporosarcina antarctica]|uniref:non-specific protein-tyrosine kinase n=1 Tax=Paenisporosarcina antarctica TaxID=417367 RepID=A0A4P6ZW00_9BACL|nr:polysaccharide biosynthesis tyrosine autokinase [Paenisporosarcina antarctica]QBP40507.1 polysaccharide biosynthesis tyrosine autokinase [Paenisporosarcina antarctica]